MPTWGRSGAEAAAARGAHAAFHAELAAHPDPARRAGWRDHRSQRLRLAVCLAALGESLPVSVLDVGCGLGALLPLLRARGFAGDYVGLDLLPEMIAGARAQHGGDPAARFAVGDILSPPAWLAQARFDLVVACGVLSLRMPSHAAYVDAMLAALWARTGGALALVVPSARARRRLAGLGDDFVCYEVGPFAQALRRHSPWLTLREDFLPTDLAAYLYRDHAPALSCLSTDPAPWPPADLAALYLERDLPAAALALLEPIPPTARDATTWLLTGKALAALGARDPAADALRAALRLDPSLYAAQLALEGLLRL